METRKHSDRPEEGLADRRRAEPRSRIRQNDVRMSRLEALPCKSSCTPTALDPVSLDTLSLTLPSLGIHFLGIAPP